MGLQNVVEPIDPVTGAKISPNSVPSRHPPHLPGSLRYEKLACWSCVQSADQCTVLAAYRGLHGGRSRRVRAAQLRGPAEVFAGDLNRAFKAFDETSGELLWQTGLDDVPSSTVATYSVDGMHYVAIVVGQTNNHVNAWAPVYSSFAPDAIRQSTTHPREAPRSGCLRWVTSIRSCATNSRRADDPPDSPRLRPSEVDPESWTAS